MNEDIDDVKKYMSDNKEFTSFYKIYKDTFDQLEPLLNSHGIKIKSGSDLERICLNTLDLINKVENPKLRNPYEDIRPYFSEIMGFHDLLDKILKVKDHDDFDQIITHLKLLNISAVPQNTKSLVTDQGSNKLFELYIATLCMLCGTDVKIDNPNNSDGKNPDILANIEGQRWGFACKVPHTTNHKTFIDRLNEGIRQIDCSEAEIGAVIFNFKNIINHDKVWPLINKIDFEKGAQPLYASYSDIQDPVAIMKYNVDKFIKKCVEETDEKYLKESFQNSKSINALLAFVHINVEVLIKGFPTATVLKTLNGYTIGALSDKNKTILNILNNKILGK